MAAGLKTASDSHQCSGTGRRTGLWGRRLSFGGLLSLRIAASQKNRSARQASAIAASANNGASKLGPSIIVFYPGNIRFIKVAESDFEEHDSARPAQDAVLGAARDKKNVARGFPLFFFVPRSAA